MQYVFHIKIKFRQAIGKLCRPVKSISNFPWFIFKRFCPTVYSKYVFKLKSSSLTFAQYFQLLDTIWHALITHAKSFELLIKQFSEMFDNHPYTL